MKAQLFAVCTALCLAAGATAQSPDSPVTRAEFEALKQEVGQLKNQVGMLISMHEQTLAALKEMNSKQTSDETLTRLGNLQTRIEALADRFGKLENQVTFPVSATKADSTTQPEPPKKVSAEKSPAVPAVNTNATRCESIVVVPCRPAARFRGR